MIAGDFAPLISVPAQWQVTYAAQVSRIYDTGSSRDCSKMLLSSNDGTYSALLSFSFHFI